MHLHAAGDEHRKLQDDRIAPSASALRILRTLAHPSALCVNDVCMMINLCILCVDFITVRVIDELTQYGPSLFFGLPGRTTN